MSPLFDFSQPSFRMFRGLYAGMTLARAAYLTASGVTTSVSEAIHAEGFSRVRFQNQGIPSVHVWSVREGTIVVFEGTRTTSEGGNWLDLMLAQAENLTQHAFDQFPGKVGRYWGNMILQIWPDIQPVLGQLGRQPTVLIGHSLGGVLALLAAHLVNALYPGSVVGVMTFGAPRPGNAEFVLRTPFKHWRIYNRDDIIPDLPPETLCRVVFGLGNLLERYQFRHQGKSISFDAAGHMFLNNGDYFFNSEGVSPFSTFSPAVGVGGAHAVGEYVRRIRWQFFQSISNEESILDELHNRLNLLDGATWRIDFPVGHRIYRVWE